MPLLGGVHVDTGITGPALEDAAERLLALPAITHPVRFTLGLRPGSHPPGLRRGRCHRR